MWGDSLRAYGLAACALTAAYVFFGRAALAGQRADLLLACASAIVSVQTAYQTVPLVYSIAACAAAVAWRGGDRPRAYACAAAFGGAMTTLLPYAGILVRYRTAYVVRSLPLGVGSVAWSLCEAVGGVPALAVWIATLIAAVSACRRLPPGGSRERALVGYGVGVVVTAILLQSAFIACAGYSAQPWYFILPLTVVALGAETVLSGSYGGSLAARARPLLLVAALATSVPSLARRCVERRTNVDLAAARVGRLAGDGDLVLVHPWFVGIGVSRYFHGRTAWTTIPPIDDHSIHRYDLVKDRMRDAETEGRLLAQTRRVLGSGGRLWLLGGLPLRAGPGDVRWGPAPSSPGGWRSDLYCDHWAARLRSDVESHGYRFVPVDLDASGPVNPYEDLRLWVTVRSPERSGAPAATLLAEPSSNDRYGTPPERPAHR